MQTKKQKTNNISCEEALKRLFDYIDGFLENKSSEEFENHIEACRGCLKKAEFQLEVKRRLGKLKSKAPSNELNLKINKLINSLC